MTNRKLRFDVALLPDGWAEDVCIEIAPNGVISCVNAQSKEGDHVRGTAIPGLCNVHSHAHQRLMQGLAERAGPIADSFWTWREIMYSFALKLQPEDLEAVAAMAYVEMLCGGYTAVGEFQYLHHQPDGTPYDNPAELSLRCVAASQQVGLAMTILPVLYGFSGFGGHPPTPAQRRFICNPQQFLSIHNQLVYTGVTLGVAPHSLRAVTLETLGEVLSATPKSQPIHIHVAEQAKEVEDCQAWSGQRPVEYLMHHFPLGQNWCTIHATHMTQAETKNLANTGAVAGLCPTTEANLGDGVFPAGQYRNHRGHIAIGSDSHISLSAAEELRMLEYSQRLAHHTRNALADGPGRSTGMSLLGHALQGGAMALQQNNGEIAVGKNADIIVLGPDHPSQIGRQQDNAVDAWIFSGGNAAISEVYAKGRRVVEGGRHINHESITKNFKAALRRLQ